MGARNETLGSVSGVPLESGRFVLITIEDEGTGIPPEHLDRIFDPYFTTKQTGSGLGLATVHSIIQKHGGHITATSPPGKGTTFTLYLPASTGTPLAGAQPDDQEPARGTGHILVMDDDPGIRKMASRQLERLGYRTTVSEDGKEAITLYQRSMEKGEPFSAVIMDLTIPGGMGGKEAVLELLALDPHAVVLVASGYANDPVVAHCTDHGFIGAVPKPFTLKELGQALSAALKK